MVIILIWNQNAHLRERKLWKDRKKKKIKRWGLKECGCESLVRVRKNQRFSSGDQWKGGKI